MNTSSDTVEGSLAGSLDDQFPTLIPPSHTKSFDRKDPLPSEPPDAGLYPQVSSDTVPAEALEPDDQLVRAALAASTRTEASLSGLMRALQTLSNGVSSAREANVDLVRELEALREMLAHSKQQQLVLKNRVGALEEALENTQQAAASERAFLIDQHDNFIAGLIEDHEHLVLKLSTELDEARQRTRSTPPPPLSSAERNEAQLREQLDAAQRGIEKLVSERDRTRDALLRLQAQRDEAQGQVVKLARERDLARSDLAQFRIQHGLNDVARGPSSRPPSSSVKSGASSWPAAELGSNETPPPPVVGQVRITRSGSQTGSNPLASLGSSTTSTSRAITSGAARPTAPPLEFKSSPRHTPPPDELRDALALGATAPEAGDRPSSPAIKIKPDPSTRPLVGYSVTEASEDHVDTTRITSTRPPQR
jgi:predicted  nucleic acid-binding Zn-ribbon protein